MTLVVTLLVLLVAQFSTANQDYVSIIRAPRLIQDGTTLVVTFECSRLLIIGVELRVSTEVTFNFEVFSSEWECSPILKPQEKTITVKLPSSLAYQPDHEVPDSLIPDHAVFVAWMLHPDVHANIKGFDGDFYEASSTRLSYDVHFLPPFSRPQRPSSTCPQWIKQWTAPTFAPVTPWQPEVLHGVDFPVVMSNGPYGIHRVFESFSDPTRERIRLLQINRPVFTIVLTVYLDEYCPMLCGLFHRVKWNDDLLTPVIYITSQGHLHVQYTTRNAGQHAFRVTGSKIVPTKQWVRIYLSYQDKKFTMGCQYGVNFTTEWQDVHRVPSSHVVYLDEHEGVTAFGGSEVANSFLGFMGDAIVYRGRSLPLSQVPKPCPSHPMYTFNLDKTNSKCRALQSWLRAYKSHLWSQQSEDHCEPTSSFAKWTKYIATQNTCKPHEGAEYYNEINQIIEAHKITGSLEISQKLQSAAMDAIVSPNDVPGKVRSLEQAACLGSNEASFVLATIQINGVGTKSDVEQGLTSLFHCAIQRHPLCLMALAHRHMHALDGFTADPVVAYAYYREVGEMSKHEKNTHSHDGVMTEHVRLTDDVAMDAQTAEGDDVFEWLRNRAAAGAVDAQRNLARLMYWGQQGVKRNVELAMQYYKAGAENSNDPGAQYDYGVVLLKGHGTKKNEAAAMQQFEKLGARGDHRALNALGWYALERKKDPREAEELFSKADELGNPDAAYNLGHMYWRGRTADKKRQQRRAFAFMSRGAARGSLEAGLSVSSFNMRGHPEVPRNTGLAVEWARFIAEKHPSIGRHLRQGLKAVQGRDWFRALLFYHVAAETGVEVATFNLAHLCETDPEGLLQHIERECMIRNYRLSIQQRSTNAVHHEALIKVGDFHWEQSNASDAVELYTQAAAKGDPQGFFNLAYLVEEGVELPESTRRKLSLPSDTTKSSVIISLYKKCQMSHRKGAYLPCTLALWRFNAQEYWNSVLGWVS
ncbi:hypothetical protein CAPTEDRAFT_191910 [Capitella teleta]|uniref:Uncharacterized protein n=1 Tax=Capitella teleta TaxID=283909 RepID=R7VJM4_CAPTE|nr:hypothetical protein CAPTEDRAFT_191910 [Capitella teleta]|eukprot:ELU16606.1 hypothetical protein CAPTEDRAFT_191910 [Capitella teleta]